MKRLSRQPRNRAAAILEYVILAVGIAIFVTFGVLKFGKAAQHQLNEATQVLAGVQEANTFNPADQPAQESADDNTQRTAVDLGRN